jgi:hypothetical protein
MARSFQGLGPSPDGRRGRVRRSSASTQSGCGRNMSTARCGTQGHGPRTPGPSCRSACRSSSAASVSDGIAASCSISDGPLAAPDDLHQTEAVDRGALERLRQVLVDAASPRSPFARSFSVGRSMPIDRRNRSAGSPPPPLRSRLGQARSGIACRPYRSAPSRASHRPTARRLKRTNAAHRTQSISLGPACLRAGPASVMRRARDDDLAGGETRAQVRAGSAAPGWGKPARAGLSRPSLAHRLACDLDRQPRAFGVAWAASLDQRRSSPESSRAMPRLRGMTVSSDAPDNRAEPRPCRPRARSAPRGYGPSTSAARASPIPAS